MLNTSLKLASLSKNAFYWINLTVNLLWPVFTLVQAPDSLSAINEAIVAHSQSHTHLRGLEVRQLDQNDMPVF